MVIAADGRELRDFKEVISEDTQKIFEIPNAPAAYAIFGTTRMSADGNNHKTMNLIEEARKAQLSVSLDKCEDLLQYAERFSKPIQEKLSHWRTDETIMFPPLMAEPKLHGNPILHLFLFGYHHGIAETIDVMFYHRHHILCDPTITTVDVGIGYPAWVRGSDKVAEKLFDSKDKRFSPYRKFVPKNWKNLTIPQASRIARDYIRACKSPGGRAVDRDICFSIGGHIHSALIAPEGFRWLTKPMDKR